MLKSLLNACLYPSHAQKAPVAVMKKTSIIFHLETLTILFFGDFCQHGIKT